MNRILLAVALAPLLLPAPAQAQNLAELEKRVTEFTLPNGMHFIVLERRPAPVASFHIYVGAGAVDDSSGQTGMAHMFEHMAFKGTETIGSKNYAEEKKALEAIDRIYDQLEAERRKGSRADAARLAALEKQVKAAIENAGRYVEPNLFTRIIEENGGVGLNAGTGEDSTNYFDNFPANRVELWFLLASERFLRPVYREFYKERDVVREELRMRVESDPQGKLINALLNAAFVAHPYRVGPAGWGSDIENFRLREAVAFYKKYYVPANMTVAIAGDVAPAEMKRLALKYFGRIPPGPRPPAVRTVEPPQEGARRVEIESPSQPLLVFGYKRPDQAHPDDPVFDVINGVLGSGRTGLLYKELVRDKQIALGAFAAPSFPGVKYPNMFVILVAPNMGKTIAESEKACYEVIERLKKETIDAATLNRVKTNLRASVIRQLDSNSGMAEQLAFYHVNYGDWRKLINGLDDINKVTAEDVKRVVAKYFIDRQKTVAYTVIPPDSGAGKPAGEAR